MRSPLRRSAAIHVPVALALTAWLHAAPAYAQVVNEGFDSAALPAGWLNVNNSQFANTASGNWGRPPGPFNNPTGDTFYPISHQGSPEQYFGVGHDSSTGVNPQGNLAPAVISNWLMTPALQLTRDGSMSFFTRTLDGNINGDRLQVWFSPTGGADVGPNPVQGTPNITPGDQIPQNNGDFTFKLLDINPDEVSTRQAGAYPEQWTQFTMSLSSVPGLPTGTFTGRFGFRYYAEDGGPFGTFRPSNGNNDFSNFLGIDTVSINPVPEPASLVLTGATLPALAWIVRRRKRQSTDQGHE
jgi:hypothetical protein